MLRSLSQPRLSSTSLARSKHWQPIEEVTAAAPTPNHFWRMMTDPGFSSPASNPAPFVVTTEAFLGLTSQVQALAGMVQTIVSYLPQLMHSVTHQLASPTTLPQTESPIASNQGALLETEPPQRQVVEACTASPTPVPARLQSRSCDLVQTDPDFDNLSSDTADSLREQVRLVHQRLDEVQKEVLKSKGARPKTTTASLLGLIQGSDEPLSQFVGQFTSQVQGITDLHPSLAIKAFLTGLTPSRFFWSLIERPPTTLPEMLQWAHQYMAVETLVASKQDETKRPWVEQPRRHPPPPSKRREDRTQEAAIIKYLVRHDGSLRTLASTDDGGPEDAPEEPASGSLRLAPLDPEEEMTLTLLEESKEVIPTYSKNTD
ncbi:hypothetical protein B296_00006511 [Ensete ventricosum]|uniref:Retrotransposon gag domain-containing protein n=1 Tax=Ensete ventricosum TaxID=4639 RepID=A0A427AAU0_ENSVE|nr:hypothetical protein B296_00006511 [Ensete ventricosum]